MGERRGGGGVDFILKFNSLTTFRFLRLFKIIQLTFISISLGPVIFGLI